MRGCHHLTKWISENFWTEIQKLFVKNMFALSWNNACLIHRQSLHICYSLSLSEQLTCWWPSPLFQLSLMSSGEGGSRLLKELSIARILVAHLVPKGNLCSHVLLLVLVSLLLGIWLKKPKASCFVERGNTQFSENLRFLPVTISIL